MLLWGKKKFWFDKNNYDFFERKHDEKYTPKGKEIVSEWFAKREVTDYVRFVIVIEFWIRECVDVVVEDEKGNKKEKSKGKLEMDFNSEMVKNYEKGGRRKFQYGEVKGTFHHFIKLLYERLIKSELQKYEKKLKEESKEIFNELKSALEE